MTTRSARAPLPELSGQSPPKPPRRALGRTGIVTPVLSFGVSGPLATPLTSTGQVRRLVRRALDLGVETFDTAPFYGGGRAEKRLGAALANVRRKPVIFTKSGTMRRDGRLVKDFSPDGLRRQIESSLTRLPHVDAFILHGPSPEALTRTVLRALDGMREEGLFRFLGVAGRGPELDFAIESEAFDLLMAPAHRMLPAADLERLEHARTVGLGVVGIEVLAPCASSVRYSVRPADLWYTARALMGRRPAYAADGALTPEACLNWTLASGLVDTALITTTRIEHLEQNVRAVSLPR